MKRSFCAIDDAVCLHVKADNASNSIDGAQDVLLCLMCAASAHAKTLEEQGDEAGSRRMERVWSIAHVAYITLTKELIKGETQ